MAGAADGPLNRRTGEPTRQIERPPEQRSGTGSQTASAESASRSPTTLTRPVGLLVSGDAGRPDIRQRLERRYEIIAVADVSAVGRVLNRARVDFVLIDAGLGDRDMMGIITQVRVSQWLRGTPVLCYTDRSVNAPVARLAGLAAHDFITGPADPDRLLARIEARLRDVIERRPDR